MPPINPLKILNLAPFAQAQSAEIPWLQRLQGALRYGWRWFREYPAQERLAQILQEHLDRHFLLVLNALLPGSSTPLPPLLMGPSGLHVLYPTLLKGDFRVKQNRLYIYDTGKQRFRPYRPDLVQELLAWRDQLQDFFAQAVATPPTIEARLVFLDPGTYVDSVDADIPPLMVDGLPRYLEQLSRRRKYPRETLRQWLEALLRVPQQPQQATGQAAQTRTRRERTAREQARARAARRRSPRPGGLTPLQWAILGSLFLLNLLLLVVLFVLFFILS